MSGDKARATILWVEPDPGRAAEGLRVAAERGLFLARLEGLEAVPAACERGHFEVALLPWSPACEELLGKLKGGFPGLGVVVVTAAHPPAAQVVRALRLGALDCLEEPLDAAGIVKAAEAALVERTAPPAAPRRPTAARYQVEGLVGRAAPMQEVYRLIHKVARADATVLILGESGTGKELVAKAIHQHSARRDHPLVPVNCGAIPEELLESELFGHEKGAFTGAVRTRPGRFELAEGGTVFLDEIGDMSPMLQVKLLRVLQERQFERVGGGRTIQADVRIIAATHQDLRKRVEEGKFREDLFYRLNVVPILVPPLRERRSDLPLLCEHFLARLAERKGLEHKVLHPSVQDLLLRHDWPGNVRELENLLERMVILAEDTTILPDDLPARLRGSLAEHPLPAPEPAAPLAVLHTVEMPDDGLDFNAAVDAFERQLITQALEKSGWVKSRAASQLGLNRTTLVEKIKKMGLAPAGTVGNS